MACHACVDRNNHLGFHTYQWTNTFGKRHTNYFCPAAYHIAIYTCFDLLVERRDAAMAVGWASISYAPQYEMDDWNISTPAYLCFRT